MRKFLFFLVILSTNYLPCFTQILSQTKTATLLNNNFKGNLANLYPKAKVENVRVDDGKYVTSSKIPPERGGLLLLQGFNFTIPDIATIENISVIARRFKTGKGFVCESLVTLVRKRDRLPEWWEPYGRHWIDSLTPIPAIEAAVSYSQSGQGVYFAGPYNWTAAMINSAFFGVRIDVGYVAGSAVTVNYDYVEITVQYSETLPAIAPKSTLTLEQNILKAPIVYPNPFTTKTNIQFTAAENGKAVVELFNLSGVKVRTLFTGNVVRGQLYKTSTADARLPRGTYIYVISYGKQKQTGRIMKLE